MLFVVKNNAKRGFTIIELLVVIVIIGVLAAISVIVYSGIRQRAAHAAVESKATQLATQLGAYEAEYGVYPSEEDFFDNTDCSFGDYSSGFCFDPPEDEDGDYLWVDYEYQEICGDWDNPCTPNVEICRYDGGEIDYDYCAGIDVGGGGVIDISQPESCPSGFIKVPGNAKYNQKGFCVMKYEAKNVGGKAVSQASQSPWGNITQNQAISYSTAACSGCHLITEAEWMTLAANIASVGGNWTGQSVGTGKLYNGLDRGWYGLFAVDGDGAASNNDEDYYYGLPAGHDDIEKRTYKLKNGEIIWDLSGNYSEYTNAQVGSGKPGCPGSVCDWDMVTFSGTMSPSIFPGSMGISNITNDNATSLGLGQLWSDNTDNAVRAVIRGHSVSLWAGRGLLEVNIYNAPNIVPVSGPNDGITGSQVGFRAAR